MWIFHYSVLMVWMMLVDLCNFNVFGARRCPFRSPSSSRRGMSHEVTGTNQNMQFAVHESKIVVAQRTSCCQDRKNSEICCEVSKCVARRRLQHSCGFALSFGAICFPIPPIHMALRPSVCAVAAAATPCCRSQSPRRPSAAAACATRDLIAVRRVDCTAIPTCNTIPSSMLNLSSGHL